MNLLKSKSLLLIAILLLSSLVASAQPWKGMWTVNKTYTLKISDETKKSFHFALDFDNGLAKAEGDAIIKGNTALHKNSNNCQIKFELGNKVVRVKVIPNKKFKNCYSVAFNGIYKATQSYADFFAELNQQAGIETKTEPEPEVQTFESFWKEFQAAVAKGDKNKVADMSNFPLVELEEVGSGNPSYSDRSISDFNQYTFKKYFIDKSILKVIASTNATKLKLGKLSKKWFEDDDGNKVGKLLIEGMPIYTLKIGNKKSTVLSFAYINGKFLLFMVEFHNPE